MTEKQRFNATLDGICPDRAPWYADMGYYHHYLAQTKQLKPEWSGESGYFDMCRELGCGIMYYGRHPFDIYQGGGVEYAAHIDGDRAHLRYSTPIGAITSEQTYSRQSYSYGITKHFVETIEDLRVMCHIYENMRYEANFEPFERIGDLVGDDGVIFNIPPICVSAVQKLTSRWAGVENLVGIIAEDGDEFDELIERIQASESDAYDIVCGFGERYVEFCENLSSEVTGRGYFEKYNMPYYKKLNDKLHKAGKKTGIHIDGTLSPCLALLPQCGFDLAESVTPAPVGDIGLGSLRETVGDDFVIMGGLPGALFSARYSEEFFDEYLKNLAKASKPGEKFIVGVADQVPPDAVIGRMQKVRAMIDSNKCNICMGGDNFGHRRQ